MASQCTCTQQSWLLSDNSALHVLCSFLSEKDGEAYRERAQTEMRLNEQIIAFLRSENKRTRVALAEHENVILIKFALTCLFIKYLVKHHS